MTSLKMNNTRLQAVLLIVALVCLPMNQTVLCSQDCPSSTCNRCSGTGKIDAMGCRTCHSTGKERCPLPAIDHDGCAFCHGSLYITCRTCHGSPELYKMTCPDCHGTGR